MVVCIAAGVATVLATSLWVLVAARFAEGLSGSAGMVLGRAVIADLVTGVAAARAMSLMMIVGGVAPVVGPTLGGVLVGPIGWRGVLGVVLALTVLMLVLVLSYVPETLPAERREAERLAGVGGPSTTSELLSPTFVLPTLAFAAAFAVMMAYISASPFLYQERMGLSEAAYGAAFGVIALGLVLTSALSARLVLRVAAARLAGVGITVVLAACLLLLVLVLAGVPAGWYAAPILLAVAPLGLVMGNGTALALAAVPRARGAASAVLGAAQFGLGGLMSVLAGLGDGTLPQALVMTACAVVAAASFALARRVARVGAGR